MRRWELSGRTLKAGFTRYRLPRTNDAPAIDVVLADDPEASTDLDAGRGEPVEP